MSQTSLNRVLNIRKTNKKGSSIFGRAILLAALAGAFFATPVHAEKILKFAPIVPLEHSTVKLIWEPWVEKVNEEAKGEFQIKIYGMSLADSRNVWERTVNGIADIGFALNGTAGISFNKTFVSNLPMVVDDGKSGDASVALWKLYEAGKLKGEYDNVKLLGLAAMPVTGLVSKMPINNLSDVAGVKIRVGDRLASDVASALGGSAISLSATETYQALSRGLVEAAIANWVMVGSFRLSEVTTNYIKNVPLGAPPVFIIMNQKAYASLSDKGREILDRHSGALLSRHVGDVNEQMARDDRDRVMKQDNFTLTELSEDQVQEWRGALGKVVDEWVKNTPDGADILETFRVELKAAGEAQ